MKKVVCFVALMSCSVIAQAEGMDTKNFYVGGGLNFNSLPGTGSARGFQFFGGYEFDFLLNDDIKTSVEVGYLDSGNFDRINNANNAGSVDGVWASALESVAVSSKVDVLARLGYDFGDDDGLLLGAGMQYKFNTKSAMRMEYVSREHLNGLQVNVLVKF